MKYPMYCVRDVQVGFNSPMVDINDNTATRNFTMAVNDPNNGVMHFSPADYDLYRVGTFDTESGLVEPEPVPVHIVSGSSVFGSEVK